MAVVKNQDYYLGLDIGTDSVGYAATDTSYSLLKYHGEPMWGVMTFEEGKNAAERRGYRIARRRIERRKQRLDLLQSLFAKEICKIDPDFFNRRDESFLFPEDKSYGVRLFCGGDLTDEEYHDRYPTIHHLILDLMAGTAPHDIRLVYMACSWLVAHRGHFLFNIDSDQLDKLLDFDVVYNDFIAYLNELESPLPWPEGTKAGQISEIMQRQTGVKRKKDAFREEIFGGKKFPSQEDTKAPYSVESVIGLLSGGQVKLSALFGEPDQDGSVSLTGDDDAFAQSLAGLTEEQEEFLTHLRKMSDCARLLNTMKFKKAPSIRCISAAKIEVYEQHKEDLAFLKKFIRAYYPEKYSEVFRKAVKGNYASYSKHLRTSLKAKRPDKFWVSKIEFSEYLKKIVKNTQVSEEDRSGYEDMLLRLELGTFLPKQRESDNRIIPQQLYRMELDKILETAQGYLPMLSQKGADNISTAEKIQAIFSFRVPYYVGPLNKNSPNAWLIRKPDAKILPWNLEDIVDLDASEKAFIKQMTNCCTYLPGEKVVPEKSLLYGRFTVLNELNNLKVDDRPIPVEVKQRIFTDVFMEQSRVTPAKIKTYLVEQGLIEKSAKLTGLDITVKSSLYGYHAFKELLGSKKLTESQVEDIIDHCACCEDRDRLVRWLENQYPQLSKKERNNISKRNLKGFGRLSARFLLLLPGGPAEGGEQKSILEWMWDTNENLMQLLSSRYTFTQSITDLTQAYYLNPENQKSLSERLKDYRLPGSVRRSIYRTLDIVRDVAGVAGAPKKIFVEMARGGTPEQRGQRTKSRKRQLLDLYQSIQTEESRQLQKQLEDMGDMADNRLQSDVLFLYYLQMGKCAYTGHPIDLARLGGDFYNKDHIYPKCYVKDDSVLNNLVLVESTVNDDKRNKPVPAKIRTEQRGFWQALLDNGLMTPEKFRRLTRSEKFTDAEKLGFINRQLVETRQSTKVIAELLREMYPQAEIVYVKAGLVSEYRQAYKLYKCRTVNDLHHAKDAYLNIVVGNVYHERFRMPRFKLTEKYSVQIDRIMNQPLKYGEDIIWRGPADRKKVQSIVQKNAVHLTRYAFKRMSISNPKNKAGLFNQQPQMAAEKLIPLKEQLCRKELPTSKYGGYNSATVSYYVLARYRVKMKVEVMLVPVNLKDTQKFDKSDEGAKEYVYNEIFKINNQKEISDVELLLGGRKLKINTVFSFDGLRMTLSGKSSGGTRVLLAPITPLILGADWDDYIKHLDSFLEKSRVNPAILPDERHDEISRQKNLELYDVLMQKLAASPFQKLPANPYQILHGGRENLQKLSIKEQIMTLSNIVALYQRNSGGGVDLSAIGGSKRSGVKMASASFSNWKKNYSDVRIIDSSPAGLHETSSQNLLELL